MAGSRVGLQLTGTPSVRLTEGRIHDHLIGLNLGTESPVDLQAGFDRVLVHDNEVDVDQRLLEVPDFTELRHGF